MAHLYIDIKYARLLGSRLKNFKQVRGNTFAFSHSCEDFTRSKIKTRGSIYVIKDSLNFHCYHCGASSRFSTLLRQEDPNLYDEYRMETFKESHVNSRNDSIVIRDSQPVAEQEIVQNTPQKPSSALDSDIVLLSGLKSNHPVMKYVESRCIPTEFYDRIGFVPDFRDFAIKYDGQFKKSKHTHPRLVFPYYDTDDSIICYSCRAFGKEQPKYIKLAVDNSKQKLYGIWRLDYSKPIYVVEGQIDSLFIDNCIAVGSADYSSDFIIKHKDNIVIVPDSDYKRNPQVYGALEKAIDRGFKVSLFPESIPWKDVNDMVVKGGLSKEYIHDMIDANIMQGIRAKLELSFRKKF